MVLFKLVFGAEQKAVLLFYPGNFKLDCTAMCIRPCYLCEVEEVDAEIVRRDKKMAWYVPEPSKTCQR